MEERESEAANQPVAYDNPIDGILDILNQGTTEETDTTSLFLTEEGKHFAEQVKKQSSFTIIEIMLSQSFEIFAKSWPKIVQVLSENRVQNFIKEQIESAQELDEEIKAALIAVPKMLKTDYDEGEHPEEDEIGEIFGKIACERFIGSLVFALYSFIEAYIKSIVTMIVEDETSRQQFINSWNLRQAKISLGELDELSDDKNTMTTRN